MLVVKMYFSASFLTPYPLSIWKNTPFSVREGADKAQRTVLRRSIVERISPSTSSPSPTPPSSSSLLHHCLFLCGSRTPQMQQNGKWSGSTAFKALPLPRPSLFIFYPNKWWSRKQEAKTKKQKHQRPSSPPSCWSFFFFPLFTSLTISLITEFPHH